jgi:hypothetical protein
LLIENGMRMRRGEAMVGAIFVLTAALCGCTGGQEGSAAVEQAPHKNPIATQTAAPPPLDAAKQL